jgi:hypothetical protein
MPTIELTPGEAEIIRVARLSPAEREAERQARADALVAKVRARMTPAAAAAFDAERDRRAKLTEAERRAESLVARKARIEADLAKPDIAAIVAAMQDGKVPKEA